MAKFCGKVGYVINKETAPGVWRPEITEKTYYGDIIKNTSRWSASTDSTNDNISINNQISIIVDSFAMSNLQWMRYVECMGILWEITNIEAPYPRILLTMGGVYNGKQTNTASEV